MSLRFFYKVIHIGLFAILIGVAGLIFASSVNIPGNIELKVIKSGSMEPTIGVGSIILLRPIAQYHVGDVVTFAEQSSRGLPTTHRIVDVQKKEFNAPTTPHFITQGDANKSIDPQPLPQNEIVGKVLFHVPKIGFLVEFAKTQMGYLLLIVIPALIVVIEEMMGMATDFRKYLAVRTNKKGTTKHYSKKSTPQVHMHASTIKQTNQYLNGHGYTMSPARFADMQSMPIDGIRIIGRKV